MAASGRAARLLKAMDILAKKTTFDHGTVLSKMKLQPVSNGTFQGTFTVDKTMCNMGGSLHGGYIASVIDVLSFYTQLSNTDGRLSWTTSMNVNYLDDTSLQIAAHTHKTWARIILTNKKLRNRLNKFELAIKLGSESLAKFYRKNKRKLRKEKGKNYLPRGKTMESSSEKTTLKSKRGGEEFSVYTKRFKLY